LPHALGDTRTWCLKVTFLLWLHWS